MQNRESASRCRKEDWGWSGKRGQERNKGSWNAGTFSPKAVNPDCSWDCHKGQVVHKQNPSLHFPSPSPCGSCSTVEIEESAPLFPLPSNWLLFKEEQVQTVRAGRGLRDPIIPTPHFRTGQKEAQRVEGACLPVSHFTGPCAAGGQFYLPFTSQPGLAPGPCTW